MVKSYLRYRSSSVFGVIASGSGNAVFDATGRRAVVPALEDVIVWDLRKGTKEAVWHDVGNTAEVTCICRNPAVRNSFAVGYSDGSIRLWNIDNSTSIVAFNGHRSAVTAVCFDPSGQRLASGARDTDIIVWDVIGEAGLYRLKGHKEQITGLCFLTQEYEGPGGRTLNHIVSTSKDTLMKVWDLTTQHCVETVIAHRSEVWALACASSTDVLDEEEVEKATSSSCQITLFTGASDPELRVWTVDAKALAKKLEPSTTVVGAVSSTEENQTNGDVNDDGTILKAVTLKGSLQRKSQERVMHLRVHPDGKYVGVQAADKSVELYKIRSEAEIKRKLARRKRRQREKIKAKQQDGNATVMEDVDESLQPKIEDEIALTCIIRCSSKVRSFDFSPVRPTGAAFAGRMNGAAEDDDGDSSGPFGVLCALSNNSLELHQAGLDSKEEPTKLAVTLDLQGHRSDVRSLALSSDDQLLASTSNSGLKIWNVATRQCIKTIDSGYGLCCTFVPGNKHVVVGTKTGELQIFDLPSSSLLESIKAHEGPVWSLEVRPDKTGLTTGSADKDVKFWDFQLLNDPEYSKIARRLTLVHTRTLKMTEDVLCVRHSADSRFLAVSLLDSTVKVFYADTLKFFLSLYGHKLPVLSLDISSDSSLIVTASADKTLKIWGLDFGDCHRSIFAHEDSVMCCRFVWGTHYVFTAGKDRCVKYWDADKFEQIMKLEGHHGEVWALAVGKFGNMVFSGSHDRSIRGWEKTDEQLFLEEERERELEQTYERAALQDDSDRYDRVIGSAAEMDGDIVNNATGMFTNAVGGAGAGQSEVGIAAKKTMESLMAGEKIMEALDVWEEDRGAMDAYEKLLASNPNPVPPPPPRSPFIIALNDPTLTPEQYVLRIVERVRSSDLEQALLVLPFVKIEALIKCVAVWVKKGWNLRLSSRVINILIQTHYSQLGATGRFSDTATSSTTTPFSSSSLTSVSLRPLLQQLQVDLRSQLQRQKDTVGFNLAALRYLRRQWESEHSKSFFDPNAADDDEWDLGSRQVSIGALGPSTDANKNGKDSSGKKKGASEKGKRKRMVLSSS
ncbi:hypothetical protein HK102_003159 [Quaeritorhiza haematococci]|nr:hypothetical protein HK102_003159 [Quaeritorhiza haematococci]